VGGARAVGGPAIALVRFSGGGSGMGSIGAVTLEDARKRELARWSSGEGELPEALAAPIWAGYALFRGHPRVSGWGCAGAPGRYRGGGGKFEVLLSAPRRPYRSS
jgi:hypothetical protein